MGASRRGTSGSGGPYDRRRSPALAAGRPDWRSVLEAGRRRQEGCPPRTHNRVAAPGAGGRGGLSASQAGPRAGPDSDRRRRWRRPTALRSLANCWAHFNSNPTKTLTNSNPKKIREIEENQSVRMEELPSMIGFLSFPLRIGWRMEWI